MQVNHGKAVVMRSSSREDEAVQKQLSSKEEESVVMQ